MWGAGELQVRGRVSKTGEEKGPNFQGNGESDTEPRFGRKGKTHKIKSSFVGRLIWREASELGFKNRRLRGKRGEVRPDTRRRGDNKMESCRNNPQEPLVKGVEDLAPNRGQPRREPRKEGVYG